MRVTAILHGPRRLYALDKIWFDVADSLHGRHYRGPALACPHRILFSHLQNAGQQAAPKLIQQQIRHNSNIVATTYKHSQRHKAACRTQQQPSDLPARPRVDYKQRLNQAIKMAAQSWRGLIPLLNQSNKRALLQVPEMYSIHLPIYGCP